MSTKVGRRDVEDRVCEKAEEIAQKRFSLSFDDLDKHQQMRVWTDAEQEVQEQLIEEVERSRDERHERWVELELMRRLGK